jgi:hypothetical protein
MNEGRFRESVGAKRPSRLRAALTARLSLLLCDGNVKKSAGRHRLRCPPTNPIPALNRALRQGQTLQNS